MPGVRKERLVEEGKVTHSLGNGRIRKQAREEHDFAIRQDCLNDLTTSNIGIGGIHQRSWDERWSLGDIVGVVGAVKNVVLEDGLDESRVI